MIVHPEVTLGGGHKDYGGDYVKLVPRHCSTGPFFWGGRQTKVGVWLSLGSCLKAFRVWLGLGGVRGGLQDICATLCRGMLTTQNPMLH